MLKEKENTNIINLSKHNINNNLHTDNKMDVDDLETNAKNENLSTCKPDPFFQNDKKIDVKIPRNLFIGEGNHHYESIYSDNENSDEEMENSDEDNESNIDEDDESNILNIEDELNDEKLLISQSNNEYMVSSKVDDYKYCPEIYKNLSLYEWTRLSVKINAKLKKNDPTYLQFLPGHNQRKTHKVKCITSRSDTFILNFIGGTLP